MSIFQKERLLHQFAGIYKYIISVCESSQKNYYWNYPEWFDTRIYHSIYELIVAFMERNICIKYYIILTKISYVSGKFEIEYHDLFFNKRTET